MKNYLQNREKAMAWVNSKDHDFESGLTILKDAGFKPGVVSVLARHGSGNHESDERLMYHMRDFIKAYANATAREDTDLVLGVADGKELQPEKVEPKDVPTVFDDEITSKLEAGEFPPSIAEIIQKYRDAFVERDRLRYAMADLPENNDDKTVTKRKAISDRAKELADLMDELHPQYAAYISEGKLPEETTDSDPGNAEYISEGQSSNPDKQQLQKQRKSIATKILRARNMLLYQKETKQDVENPMTDPKKVTKYQAKIDKLTKELEEIDMQIAKLA